MIGIYWNTVTRWMMMRARRDVKVLQKPLYILRAADSSTPAMPRDLVAKMLNGANVNTGGKPSTWFPPGQLVELSFFAPSLFLIFFSLFDVISSCKMIIVLQFSKNVIFFVIEAIILNQTQEGPKRGWGYLAMKRNILIHVYYYA